MGASVKGSKSDGGILKLTGKDGRVLKKTHFSRDQWEEEGNMHILDVWACNDSCLVQIQAAAKKVQNSILLRKAKGKRKTTISADTKQSCRSSYMAHVVSDSDFWYVL